MKKLSYPLYLSFIFLIACSLKSTPLENEPVESFKGNFGDYWYQGLAEITSYKLDQARYGEIHEGHAVMVFVTEDFSKAKQVKLDYPREAGNDAVKVMKLNMTKKFNTGIYPYSMMQSVFTPINRKEHPNTLKLTASSQEWCGHTFTQLNLGENNYDVKSLSYFESEGDEELALTKTLTEDEIFNLIRIDPKYLPTGDIQIIPGLFFQRLTHQKFDVASAQASLTKNGKSNSYTINYPGHNRKLTIEFNKDFPYEILGWEESYQSGWGAGAKILTTKATKMKSIMSDYWNKNHVADLSIREELGL